MLKFTPLWLCCQSYLDSFGATISESSFYELCREVQREAGKERADCVALIKFARVRIWKQYPHLQHFDSLSPDSPIRQWHELRSSPVSISLFRTKDLIDFLLFNVPKLEPDSFGTRLKQFRSNKGWTLRKAASFAGITNGYLCMLEQDKRDPGMQVILKLCRAYNVTLDDLLKDLPDA